MIVRVPESIRPIVEGFFSDITPAAVLGVQANEFGLDIEFDADLTAEQRARIKIRCASVDQTEEDTLNQAFQAITQIRTFNNLASPTNAQVVAQVKLLGNAVIRIIQKLLEDYSI